MWCKYILSIYLPLKWVSHCPNTLLWSAYTPLELTNITWYLGSDGVKIGVPGLQRVNRQMCIMKLCVGMQTGCLGVMLHLKSSCLACNWLVRAHMAAYMCARTNYAHTHRKLCHTLSHIQARTQLRNLFFVCHNCLRILDHLY